MLLAKLRTLFTRKLKTLNRIELFRENLLHNYDLVQKLHPEAQVWPILKADAYGHGIVPIATILRKRNFAYYVVDSAYEAIRLKPHTHNHPCLVIGYTHPDNLPLLDFRNLALTIYDTTSLVALGALRRPVNIHLKLNTGMNRQGITPDELPEFLKLLERYPTITLEGVFSHFADADGENDHFTRQQQATFEDALHLVRKSWGNPRYIHLANTAGSAKLSLPQYNALRLGIGLYGINPLHASDTARERLADLKPVLRFVSTLIKVNDLAPGDAVSYGLTFKAKQAMRIGVLPAGYYEVFDRRLSNQGFVRYQERQLPIVGRICMNMTMVDLQDTDAHVGEELEVISTDSTQPNSVMGMERIAGLFPYETLTKLSPSTRRVVV